MRESLKQSVVDSPVKNFDGYPAGSVVLCNACAMPIYRLERGISLGSGAGGAASAFKPLRERDLEDLANRQDIDAGVRAHLATWTPEQRRAHCQKLWEPKSGEPMLCPLCLKGFAQVLSITAHEVLDRAYTIELLTIPPAGAVPVRGKRLGADRDWLHPDAKAVED